MLQRCQYSSKFSICKWCGCKDVNTLARLNIFSISICDLGMPKICLAKTATFRNCLFWLYHRARGSSHATRVVDKLLNKDDSLMTSAWKDSSHDASSSNMLSSSLSSSPRPIDVHPSTIGFRGFKTCHERWNYSFQIIVKNKLNCTFTPTNFSTTCNDLNKRSNIMASMLWTWFKLF